MIELIINHLNIQITFPFQDILLHYQHMVLSYIIMDLITYISIDHYGNIINLFHLNINYYIICKDKFNRFIK